MSAAAGLVGRWCGVTPDRDGEIWVSHFLNDKVVEMEAGARVGFRFRNGDVHSRSAASLRGPVKDKMFRWHKSDTWGGGKRLWPPCPPTLTALRFALLVEGETSGVAAAYGLSHRADWWVAATTGAGMFPERNSEAGRVLLDVLTSASAVAVAWPDDDTAGSRWLEGAERLLEGFPLGVVKTSGDPRTVWRTMLAADGLDEAAGRFAGMCDKAAASAVIAAPPPPPPRFREPPGAEPVSASAVILEVMKTYRLEELLQSPPFNAQPRGRGSFSCGSGHHAHGDRNPSLSVFKGGAGTPAYKCFGCGTEGDIMTAYAAVHHSSDQKAAFRHIRSKMNGNNSSSSRGRFRRARSVPGVVKISPGDGR